MSSTGTKGGVKGNNIDLLCSLFFFTKPPYFGKFRSKTRKTHDPESIRLQALGIHLISILSKDQAAKKCIKNIQSEEVVIQSSWIVIWSSWIAIEGTMGCG